LESLKNRSISQGPGFSAILLQGRDLGGDGFAFQDVGFVLTWRACKANPVP